MSARLAPRRYADDHLSPDEVPEVYAVVAQGRCLEPIYRDGVCLVFSKSAPIKAGDFVLLWLRPGVAPPGHMPRMVKRLAFDLWPGARFPYQPPATSMVEPLVVVEMLNPPKRLTFRASDILAIHKVVGTAETMDNGMAAVPKDSEAARLAARAGGAQS